jgi:uncharacterized protein (DUF433 family)
MAMLTLTKTIPLPLAMTEAGVIRVGGTRVTLDSVVYAFNEGATAEEIVHQFPTLNLADVYAVIGYYLQHQREVGAYLQKQQAEAEELRGEIEARFDPNGIRDRLLARRKK